MSNVNLGACTAYSIALAHGFEGTEAEWLASLKGDPGNTGPQGATGPQGPAGASAFDQAKAAGYTGTETAFGAALSGLPTHLSDTDLHISASERAAWNAKAAKPTVRTLTLSTAGWDSTAKTQTVTCSGVLSDEAAQLITVTPALASQSAYLEAGVRCTAQAADALTFTAGTVPTAELTVYAAIQSL